MPKFRFFGFRDFLARFQAGYEGRLVNRLALRAQLLMFVVLIVTGLVAYAVMFDLIRSSVIEHLQDQANLLVQRLDASLDQDLNDTANLSRRSLVANGLVDSSGSQAYLQPFLQEYRQSYPELNSISLFDTAGHVVASSALRPAVPEGVLQSVLKSNQPVFRLLSDSLGPRLLIAFPVLFQATGTTEGGLIGDIDLKLLAASALQIGANQHSPFLLAVLKDEQGQVIFRRGKVTDEEMVSVETPLGGVLAKNGVNLKLTVALPQNMIFAPLVKVSQVMIGAAVLVLLLIFLLTRRMAQSVLRPLEEMSQRAMEIAGAGPAGLRKLSVEGSDEVGQMGAAFNAMVLSLRAAYQTQEDEVRVRNQELAGAREVLTRVLANTDDVVYATNADFSRFEYVSPASEQVFGYAPQCFGESPSFLRSIVLPEDRAIFDEAHSRLENERHVEVQYRILHANGTVRWMLDRCHWVQEEVGGESLVSGLIRDVSEKVAAEASLRLRDQALASSSCGVVISDMCKPGRPIVYVNEAFERITGYASEEVIGRNCSFLQGQETDAFVIDSMRRALSEGSACQVILRNFKKDGEPFWNDLRLSPLRDSQGTVTHFIGVQNDITAMISANQALVESEARLALTIDALDEGVWDWTLDDNRLITSPSWAHILCLDQVNFPRVFDSFIDHVPDEWRDKVLFGIRQHLSGDSDLFLLEHQMIRGDGARIWVANRGRVVERDEDGKALRMVGTIIDITDRYEASEQIIELMRRLDAIFTLSPDAFAYFDEEGLLSFVNPAFERMTGIRSWEISGTSMVDFEVRLRTLADPSQPFPDLSDKTLGQQGGGALIYLVKPARRVLLISRRGGTPGSPAVAYMRDVTVETEVDRMKSEFLSTAAHELRTPMASIMGFTELLTMRDFPPERVKEILGTILRQSRRLTDLLNELLDLARIEARTGKVFYFAEQPLLPLIRDAVSAINVDGDRNRMQLDLPAQLPDVSIDAAKLQQALLNVLSNAYKYSPAGGAIEISVCERTESGVQQVGVVVRDHGIGMTPEQNARVFERFFRADPSGNIPGTGLGMSLVKEIMNAHKGSVDVESAYGDGTRVTLWLPVAPSSTVVPEGKIEQIEEGEHGNP